MVEQTTNKMSEYLSISEASIWASDYLEKNVTTSNISYLIQYGRITKIGENGSTLISKEELINYYKGQKKDQTRILERRIGRRPQLDIIF